MSGLSLKTRLIIYFILIACTVFGCAGFLAWQETKEKADEFFDTYQLALARTLAGGNWHNITPQIQKQTNKLIKNIRNADEDDDAIGFAVFDTSGKKIFHDNENGKDFVFQDNIGKFISQKVDEDNWRVIWLQSADNDFYIAVGQELEYREDMAWDMLEEFMLPWLAGLITLLLMISVLISYEFVPLKKLAKNLTFRKADDLTPLAEDKIPSEVRPLIQAMNCRMEQISELLQRERRFISDAAHELRTPLTALKIQLDVAKISTDDKTMQDSALQKIDLGLDRATRLVEQLLALSRLEASLNAIQEEDINWAQVVEQLVEEYHSEAEHKHQKIITEIKGEGPFVKGSKIMSVTLLRNLLDNAIKYAPIGAEIFINVDKNKLEVINSNTVIEEKYLSQLSERFFRLAGQNEKGSGLGLSIVECIAENYGCKLLFANKDKGFSVSIVKN